MKAAIFSAKSYDRQFLEAANVSAGHELQFVETRLSAQTASLAKGVDAVCVFVNDALDRETLRQLQTGGTRLVTLRSAGFNNVDLSAAREYGLRVARIPAYSPHAVAEHTVALILALNRKIHRAYARVREGNFALDGLLGFDLRGHTVGIVGVGKIGIEVARIMQGFGCRLLGTDPEENAAFRGFGGRYVPLTALLAESDIVTLHCPLAPATRHLIDGDAVAAMKPGVMLINTSRGAVVDTRSVIRGLKSGRIGYLGLDVYEEEADLFFENLSDQMIQDDIFARLLTFPNVLVTGHQAFFTAEALTAIAETTIGNISAFAATGRPIHEVSVERIA